MKHSIVPEKKEKDPFYIPIKMGLLDQSGEQILEDMMILTQPEQCFEYNNIEQAPVLSILRDFSAPIILAYADDVAEEKITDDRAFLMAYDSDPFNRWEAGQQLAGKLIIDAVSGASPMQFNSNELEKFIHGCGEILADTSLDNALKSQALVLPAEAIY